ncbi:MAG: molybdopterin molybdotransferase MoeA [Rhizobiaceae bacterium]|nr:molybdopterin molybdotransferase MoeA [Rhizobiaceae bacterium]
MDATAQSPHAFCSSGTGREVITVDVASAKAIAAVCPVTEVVRLPLLDAAGRVLAGDIVSPIALPPFANSAMDGYAIRMADLEGSGPWTPPVRGRMRAGDAGIVGPAGSAIRIFTGAPIPEGFDTVVMQERCQRDGNSVIIPDRPRPGQNVRPMGEDVRRGDLLLGAGAALSPQKLALLAGAGIGGVDVLRKVRVAIVSTGNELRDPGEELKPGQIYNSNRTMLIASLASLVWVEFVDWGIVPDDRQRLLTSLKRAAAGSDVLITTGGVSAGEEDHVAAVLRDSGAELDVLKVSMRPGKPVKIGRVGATLIAALPGNPNAALVTFRQIVLPAIRKAAGLHHVDPDLQPAISGFSYRKPLGRTEFVPVRIQTRNTHGVPMIQMLGRGSSSSLPAMALADGIALLPPDKDAVEYGDSLRFEPLV